MATVIGLTRRVHRRSVPPCERGVQRAALFALPLLPRVTLAVGFQYSLTLFFFFSFFFLFFFLVGEFFFYLFFFSPFQSHSRLPCAAKFFAKIRGMAWTPHHVLLRRFHRASGQSIWAASRRVPSRPFLRVLSTRNPDRTLHVTLPNAQNAPSSPYPLRMEDYPCELIR